MMISTDAEKTFNEVQYPFMIKIHLQSRPRGNAPQHNKVFIRKPTANIILDGEKPSSRSFSPKARNKVRTSALHHFYSAQHLKS